MSSATLTRKGQVVIPVAIRRRYGLTPGTRVEFVDDKGVIRLTIKKRAAVPESGYGLIRVRKTGKPRSLLDFDAANIVRATQQGTSRK